MAPKRYKQTGAPTPHPVQSSNLLLPGEDPREVLLAVVIDDLFRQFPRVLSVTQNQPLSQLPIEFSDQLRAKVHESPEEIVIEVSVVNIVDGSDQQMLLLLRSPFAAAATFAIVTPNSFVPSRPSRKTTLCFWPPPSDGNAWELVRNLIALHGYLVEDRPQHIFYQTQDLLLIFSGTTAATQHRLSPVHRLLVFSVDLIEAPEIQQEGSMLAATSLTVSVGLVQDGEGSNNLNKGDSGLLERVEDREEQTHLLGIQMLKELCGGHGTNKVMTQKGSFLSMTQCLLPQDLCEFHDSLIDGLISSETRSQDTEEIDDLLPSQVVGNVGPIHLHV